MMTHDATDRPDDREPGYEPGLEPDFLMNRLIDGRATDADHARFDQLAAASPGLWRELALRQGDAVALADRVEIAIADAGGVDLPRRWLVPARMTWTMALSGWAAMLILAVTWSIMAGRPGGGPDVGGRPVAADGARLTAEDHFREYLGAPYVLGDMQPMVVEVDQMSDGRVAVHFIRRVEEILFLDPEGDLPLDDSGELIKDLAQLREPSDEAGPQEG